MAKRWRNSPENKQLQRRAWYLEQKRKFMSRGCEWDGGCTLVDVPFMQDHGEYDHKDRTQWNFLLSNWFMKPSLTEDDFKEEEKKCRPLCPCHHQQHTHHQQQEDAKTRVYSQKPVSVRSRRSKARGRKHNKMRKRKRGACHICNLPVVKGEESMFAWDHKGLLPPNKRRKGVSSLLSYATSTIDEEIKKCRLLCHNCHMQWTKEQVKQANALGLKAPAKRKKVRIKTGCVSRVGQKWMARGPYPKYKYLGLHPTEAAARAKLAQYEVGHPEEFGMIVNGK